MLPTVIAAMIAGYVEIGPNLCQVDWLVTSSGGVSYIQTVITTCGQHIDYD
jgi:hypothetical protein